MRTLVVFYSRSGNTRKVARKIAGLINSDIEELLDKNSRKGPLGLLKSVVEVMKHKRARLQPTIKNPSLYDLVLIGTPIWGNKISSPVITYMEDNKDKFKKTALFCTAAGESERYSNNCFKVFGGLVGQKPVAFLGLDREDLKNGFDTKVASLISIVASPYKDN